MYPGNFYNPYSFSRNLSSFQGYNGINSASKVGGLFGKGFFKGASWDGFLTSAGKTLNVINQAIPIFYQVKPIFHNAKTMFRVLGAVRGTDTTSSPVSTPTSTPTVNLTKDSHFQSVTSQSSPNRNFSSGDGNPTFFL